MQLLNVLFVASAVLVVRSAKVPSEWPLCKGNDGKEECVVKAVQVVAKNLVNGNPSLGLIPTDPLKFEEVQIKQGTGPVSVDLDLKKVKIEGLKDVVVESVKIDWKSGEFRFNFTVPKGVTIDAMYNIKGKVLVLPIEGNGPLMAKMDNVHAEALLKGKVVEKNGKSYFDHKETEVKITPAKTHFNFQNLFNGDKALGDSLNTFINENDKDIINELKPAISKALDTAVTSLAKRVFEQFSLNELELI